MNTRILIGLAVGLALVGCTARVPKGMVRVPAGFFTMGTDEADLEEKARAFGIAKPWVLDATPAHEVFLETFYIHRYEVTNAEYYRFVRETGFSPPPNWRDGRPAAEQKSLPVVFVNWHEAQAYCDWIGGRLPTEAEWEKAARGTDGRLYPWGDQFDPDRANFGGRRAGLTPVGSFPEGQSPYGVMDMVGNVWEWTASLYRPYPGSEYRTPEYEKSYRAVRGNSWSELGHFPATVLKQVMAGQARVTYRLFLPPDVALEDVGFRCAYPK